jgi:hypothetical protein
VPILIHDLDFHQLSLSICNVTQMCGAMLSFIHSSTRSMWTIAITWHPSSVVCHIIGPGSHVEYPTGTKNSNFVEDHPRNIPAKFGSNWPSGFGEEALSGPIICSDWLKFQRSSSLNLKLMNWLNPNCKLMTSHKVQRSSVILWFDLYVVHYCQY